MARPLLPLNALRAFEAAARHLNFSRAADELSVTPGAVSQQIRLLEDIVGGPLFVREARGLQLTDLGRSSVPLLREGFERLTDASALLREPPRRKQVSISVAPGFASKWLMPRMDDFHAAHPEIELWISADMEPADLTEGKVDLAAMLRDLAQREINELHLEAGSKLNASFMRAGLVDELLVYLAPRLLGPGQGLLALPALESLDQGTALDFISCERMGPDLRILARVQGRDSF